ncbi:MAG: hypothetical protein CM15mP89_3590 [Gammaproteobacteria bacterium]|nr:MAG: hypothetical protein CM15mP89_3590 [Gammaproteobacteria bacterium]
MPFITWGYHPLWHGEIWRDDLNEWFGDQPVMLWHRSFHELIGNDAAWSLLGVTEADAQMDEGADWARGHFYENGLKAVVPKLGFCLRPNGSAAACSTFSPCCIRPVSPPRSIWARASTATRLARSPGCGGGQRLPRAGATHPDTDYRRFLTRGKTPEEALAEILEWQTENDERVMVGNHFKLMIDGAIFSGLAQMGAPGYLDGHQGVWMVPEPVLRAYGEVFWRAGFQLHAHANGDAAVDRFLRLVEGLQSDFPALITAPRWNTSPTAPSNRVRSSQPWAPRPQ